MNYIRCEVEGCTWEARAPWTLVLEQAYRDHQRTHVEIYWPLDPEP